ncbi:benzoyl-CoA reductase/2-hydroxyglutaryl-CoA dehydratase subunit BcrC/BadD/HgdB [Desulfohalotomaculum tongense]|uniref:2-hydroxyacyl-CoA dehydratase family protein n=1 Tax=Desulforadius tongensis TaxID=1216062 RepID=UPI00195EBC78|nr:2-hydroxyacyl-CoA dehydratase [Desulforadius tongensis]MBM7855448.1 benzoyl-CoA reductase/2-hydroxyglutaryl-CoA dehydratase subunit BcrC/BadD/HgdB [Desulforadius tongensis]
MQKVGITTTVPVEIIYAAGMVPVDLNNIFITAENPQALVEEAEMAGYPRNLCAWIKGIYATVQKRDDINTLIAVTQGDCSNTHALMETLELSGVKVIPFAYPYDRDYDLLKLQIEKLMDAFGVNWRQVNEAKERLDAVRQKVWKLDELTWQQDRITGWDNHLYQVSCSDFNGDPEGFAGEVDAYLAQVPEKPKLNAELRLGYIGVPPIVDDLYDYLEERGARVVYNETQRQFTMPFATDDIVEQYRLYSYPYGIFYRLKDIEEQTKLRQLDGIIHYAQSFCYRQIEDLIIRQKLKVPVLTLEGDKPNKLDARTKMRVDSFIEMLR